MSAQVWVGDPAGAGEPLDVPAGAPGASLVGALVEVEDAGARLVLGAGVVIAQHGQMAAVPREPARGLRLQRLPGQLVGLGRGVGVERRLRKGVVAEPEAKLITSRE